MIPRNINADEILLVSGDYAKTEILDTSGCEVKILRNGNTVSIKKKLIQRIIWKIDTISFVGYVCAEKPRPVIKYQDTPEYKLLEIFDNAQETSLVLNENSRVAFLYAPLQGNFNSEEFAGVEAPLVEILQKKAKVSVLSSAEMLSEINATQHQFDYLFVARKYHNEINHIQKSDFAKMSALGSNSQGEKKKELYTFCDFLLYDVTRNEIVFRKKLHKKRSVWGESDYSWVGILTPDEWKKEWEKDQTNRKLDRNAQSIRKKMEKEISEYLGLKK
ncbi:MAG: hypothetical protein JXA77_01160 [Bacteroidales bacterium]|nr:hypothetical protein [Bacteroidales bacterium]